MSRGYEFIEAKAPVKAWIKGVQVEEQALQQVRNTASLPFVKGVALMPDCHWGMGSTVGSVVATTGAVVPSMVGVDIGCGMIAQRTSIHASQLPDRLDKLRSAIEARVPHGRTDNGGENDRGSWGTEGVIDHMLLKFDADGLAKIIEKHPKLATKKWGPRRAARHLGTLGTGNHFIEICLDEGDHVWVMLHSGSRGIGNAIGQHFIELAKKDMRRWFINLPDEDLAYLPEGAPHFADYMAAVDWAQEFARVNRVTMMVNVLRAISATLGVEFPSHTVAVNCHHNYVARENHFGANVLVTRKGAVRARAGELGIIPGSMGARSYIVRGKGNPDSFHSCSHGAGRAMSRGAAKKRFTLEDHARATEGVECRKDEGVLDETPGAYKPIDAVMAAQTDLVEIVYELKQVLCVKG